ncbi:MAG: hypothetical protein IPK82_08825 [Polyangiaceae bacterium]|nr:hypothetical protein [Polyangiaceae bacterium]
MNRKHIVCLGLLSSVLAAGCEPRERPVMCVVSPIPPGFGAAEERTFENLGCTVDAQAREGDEADLVDCKFPFLSDGQSFILLHQLPEGLVPFENLTVKLDTPCKGSDQSVELEYAGETASLIGMIPPGGNCAFSIIAAVANSELRCDYTPQTACNGQDLICPEQ